MAREEGRREPGPDVGLGRSAPTTSPKVGRARGLADGVIWGLTGGRTEGGGAALYPSRSLPSSLRCVSCAAWPEADWGAPWALG